MWSKYGRRRNVARENTLRPQPVSGVASRSTRERTPLATRDDTRRSHVSRRAARHPASIWRLSSGRAATRRSSSRGMSAGSFCPSPSSVAIHG